MSLDVGAGASLLVDGPLRDGYTDITLLDVSDEALGVVRRRLGERADAVAFIDALLRPADDPLRCRRSAAASHRRSASSTRNATSITRRAEG